MSAPDPFDQINTLYHFTDTRNLPLIRQRKGLFPIAVLRANGWTVPAPGGNDWSQDADSMFGMDKYIHLCFCNSHPMEYLARQSGRIQTSIFLEIDPTVIRQDGVLFTNGVSNKSGMVPDSIEQARSWVDFQVICTRMDWKIPEIRERRTNAEKCEILVPKGIALQWIRNMPNG